MAGFLLCGCGETQPTPSDPPWRAQELLLMSEVMRLVGRSLAPEVVLREMLHLLSELLGLNRGRIVLADEDAATASIRFAYGLTKADFEPHDAQPLRRRAASAARPASDRGGAGIVIVGAGRTGASAPAAPS